MDKKKLMCITVFIAFICTLAISGVVMYIYGLLDGSEIFLYSFFSVIGIYITENILRFVYD